MEKSGKQLTRRSFLKTTAVAAGVATVATSIGCTPGGGISGGGADQTTTTTMVEEKVFANWCRGNCGHQSCCLETKVREGKVVSTRIRPVKGKDLSIQPGCVKAPSNPQRIYGTHRLLYPMLQKGERGSDNWERISWDEAISMIAEKMQAAFDENGPESVGFLSSYSGNSGELSTVYYGYNNHVPEKRAACGVGPERFFRKTGITLFSPTGDLSSLFMNGFLSLYGNSAEDAVNAKNIILISNPCDSIRTAWSHVLEAKDKGSKLIVIDPRFSNSAAKADQWIPIRPGTDGAMWLAACNYIIDNDLIDYDYLRNKSIAPLLIKDDGTYLRLSDLGLPLYKKKDATTGTETEVDTEVVYSAATGEFGSSFEITDPEVTGTFNANGINVKPIYDLVLETIKPYTVEFAAEECGLSVQIIENFAKTYADGPSCIGINWGWQHYQNSWQALYGLGLMGSLTGNIGKPGASIGYMASGAAASQFKKVTLNNKAVVEVANRKINKMASMGRLPEIVNSGKWLGEDYKLRMLWIAGANPLECGIGYEAQIEAWKKIDFVIVASEYMNDTALQASLALPVTMMFEAEDFSNGFMNQKAIEPVGESKSDFEIFVELAKAMGYNDLYDKDAEGYLREILDTEDNKVAGLGYDDFHENGVFYADEITRVESVMQESNATGRTLFFLENLVSNGNGVEVTLKDRLPGYQHAYEAYASNPLREKYPLFGISYHDNYTGQSMHNHVSWLNELRGLEGTKGNGEPYTIIHETAAAERGIKTGDKIRIFNDRGSIVTLALVSKGIREDTINIPRAYAGSEMIEGHLQSLTAIEAADKITNNDSHNDWLCQVEKV